MSEKTIDEVKNLYSVNDVAEMLKLNPDTIRSHIRRGTLKATKFNNTYFIERCDVEAFLQKRTN